MAFSLDDWKDVIRQERRRLSSLVSRARKSGTDVTLSDIAGAMPTPTTVQEAKDILAQYKAWESYHDVVEFMNKLNSPVKGFDFDFSEVMNIPVPDATPGVQADQLHFVLNDYYSYMSTIMSDDNISTSFYREWWQMLHTYFTDREIAEAINDLIKDGISYRDLKFGSDWQSVQEVNDYARRVMDKLKQNMSADDLAADDAIAEFSNRWDDIEMNKQAFYAEWYQSKLI